MPHFPMSNDQEVPMTEVVSSPESSVVLQDLLKYKEYEIRVRTVAGADVSEYSDVVLATTHEDGEALSLSLPSVSLMARTSLGRGKQLPGVSTLTIVLCGVVNRGLSGVVLTMQVRGYWYSNFPRLLCKMNSCHLHFGHASQTS